VVAFHVYARRGEIEGLRVCDVTFPGDARSLGGAHAQIRVKDKLTARLQAIRIDCPVALAALRLACHNKGAFILETEPLDRNRN
jgi:hypothetical protein